MQLGVMRHSTNNVIISKSDIEAGRNYYIMIMVATDGDKAVCISFR